jgi:hypothetical protein
MKGDDRGDEALPAKGAGNMERFLALHEFEPEARQRLPHAVYEYVAGGAGEEHSIRANQESYQRIFLRPRVLRSVAPVDLSQEFWSAFACARPASPSRLPTAYASGGRAWLCPGRKSPRRAVCPQLKWDSVDRGAHSGTRGSVLVPDLRSRRPWVHARLDCAGRSGWLRSGMRDGRYPGTRISPPPTASRIQYSGRRSPAPRRTRASRVRSRTAQLAISSRSSRKSNLDKRQIF